MSCGLFSVLADFLAVDHGPERRVSFLCRRGCVYVCEGARMT